MRHGPGGRESGKKNYIQSFAGLGGTPIELILKTCLEFTDFRTTGARRRHDCGLWPPREVAPPSGLGGWGGSHGKCHPPVGTGQRSPHSLEAGTWEARRTTRSRGTRVAGRLRNIQVPGRGGAATRCLRGPVVVVWPIKRSCCELVVDLSWLKRPWLSRVPKSPDGAQDRHRIESRVV